MVIFTDLIWPSFLSLNIKILCTWEYMGICAYISIYVEIQKVVCTIYREVYCTLSHSRFTLFYVFGSRDLVFSGGTLGVIFLDLPYWAHIKYLTELGKDYFLAFSQFLSIYVLKCKFWIHLGCRQNSTYNICKSASAMILSKVTHFKWWPI